MLRWYWSFWNWGQNNLPKTFKTIIRTLKYPGSAAIRTFGISILKTFILISSSSSILTQICSKPDEYNYHRRLRDLSKRSCILLILLGFFSSYFTLLYFGTAKVIRRVWSSFLWSITVRSIPKCTMWSF